MIGAGAMRDRVQFQRRQDLDDGYGNVKAGWADLGVAWWCSMRETTGKERVAAGRVEASRTATLRVRDTTFTASVTTADAALIRGERWNIRANVPIGHDRAMRDLLLEVGVAV